MIDALGQGRCRTGAFGAKSFRRFLSARLIGMRRTRFIVKMVEQIGKGGRFRIIDGRGQLHGHIITFRLGVKGFRNGGVLRLHICVGAALQFLQQRACLGR